MSANAGIVFALALLVTAPGVCAADDAVTRPAEVQAALRLRRELRYEEAKHAFAEWLKQHADDGQTQFEYAYTLVLQATAETNATQATKLRQEAYAHGLRARELGCTDLLLSMVLSSIDANGTDLTDPRKFSAVPAAAALIKKGEQAYAAGKWDDAFRLYQEALAIDHHAYPAALFSGDVLFAQEKYGKSIEWFSKAVGIDVNRETAHRYWGDALMKLGRRGEARDRYIDAVIAEPYNPLPREMIARFANVTKAPLRRPAIALPRVEVALKEGKTDIQYDPASGPLMLVYALERARWLGEEREKYFPKDAAPRHSLPEECSALRLLVVTAEEMASKDPATVQSLSATIATLKSLDHSGLLEACVLLERADAGIVQDYAAYRLAHRAELVRYIKQVWFNLGPQSSP